ncbi:MAG: LytTR family transcriptional regulator [Tannerellaceae bacterium]|jgi:hypothetical protein|nr:LytTR family transcriptional regulator [Tannerellaceae bacterium]
MMFKKLQTYMCRPAAANHNRPATVIVSGAVVFFLLFFFAPFGLEGTDARRRTLLAGGYALVTAAAVSVVAYVGPILFRRFYRPESWTEWRSVLNYLIVLLAVVVGNFVFSVTVFGLPQRVWLTFLTVCIAMTCIVGAVPVAIIHLYVRANSLRRHTEESRTASLLPGEEIASAGTPPGLAEVVLGGGSRDPLRISPSDLICLEASGNYLRVSYMRPDGAMAQRLLRTTLAMASAELEGCAGIMRCHRAFIVNIHYIYNVEGNSQGLRLRLRACPYTVPVSRPYIKNVLHAIRP